MAEDTRLRYIVIAVASLIIGAGIGLATAPLPAAPGGDTDRETLFQVSTIDALLQGVYDGSMTLDELGNHGDLGIGCGDRLDGELVGVDGGWYLVRTDGRAYPVAGSATTPFAAATFFDPDITIAIEEPMNLTALEGYLETELPSKNLFYAIRMDGTFSRVVARSVPVQEKPPTHGSPMWWQTRRSLRSRTSPGLPSGSGHRHSQKGLTFPDTTFTSSPATAPPAVTCSI